MYFPSICYIGNGRVSLAVVSRSSRLVGEGKRQEDGRKTGQGGAELTAAEVAFSWLDLPVTLKATPLGAVSLNSKVVADRW